jgi:hypothetical protein
MVEPEGRSGARRTLSQRHRAGINGFLEVPSDDFETRIVGIPGAQARFARETPRKLRKLLA